MEVWRPEVVEGRRPEVLSGRNFFVALGLHVAVFLVFWIVAVVGGLFKPKETVIPIDLTIVVNENLDGNEENPPPLQNPEPPPPPPKKAKPKPVEKKPDPPKALEEIATNIVKKVDKKKEEPKKEKNEAKPRESPKPEEPKKSAKELREEKIRKMRESAVKNKKPVKIEVKGPSGNGRTEKQTMSEAEIRRLLDMNYRPGKSNQLATSELQLGVSLVQMALNEKWESMAPKVGASGDVLLSCRFNSAGGLVNVRIAQTSGDGMSDAAALSVARAVTHIRNLPAGFLKEFSRETLTIRYHVRGL